MLSDTHRIKQSSDIKNILTVINILKIKPDIKLYAEVFLKESYDIMLSIGLTSNQIVCIDDLKLVEILFI